MHRLQDNWNSVCRFDPLFTNTIEQISLHLRQLVEDYVYSIVRVIAPPLISKRAMVHWPRIATQNKSTY